jgi:LPXTG-site transpeptidase (sortase) family protein
MALNSDTLSIGSIRLRKEYPVADIQAPGVLDPVIHPDAAAAARAKIAAIPDVMPIVATNVPATRTADLVTDKARLATLSQTPTATRRPVIPSALQPLLTAVGIFLVVLLLFKSPIVLSEINYSLNSHKNATAPAAATASAVSPTDNSIIIPKINVNAPVEYISSVQESDILTALESGVVHYANTADPGQPGNVAIFGHSSNDWWEPGNYKFVFVLLDKLSPGDLVYVDYQGTRYTYQVQSSTVVDPTDVGVLNPTTTPTLTLITCSPPGTSLRRLVVTAKQISPSPTTTTPTQTTQTATTTSTTLPSSAPGLFSQVQEAWNGVVRGFQSLFGASSSGAPSGSPAPTTTPGEIPSTN